MEILTGVLLGLSTLLFAGPVFFYLLKTSIEKSVKAGIAVALGIIIGDIIYVILAFKGIGNFLENELIQRWFALIGGLLLLGIGLKYIIAPTAHTELSKNRYSNTLGLHFLNGFLINFINPFVLGVWILFLSVNKERFDSNSSVILSLVTTLIIIFITDCLKVLFAQKLKKFMTPLRLKIISRIFGGIMIFFGLRFIINWL